MGIYGGSHGQIAPSFDYGGSSGGFNYFVSGDYTTDTLGIESPDGSADPLHDRTKQWHGFAFLQDILDQNSSVTAILGTSNDMFEIPNSRGLEPAGIDGVVGLGPNGVLQANGQTAFLSNGLDGRQREITHYGIFSYLHSQGAFDFQVSVFGRYSSLYYTPGTPIGELLYNGIAQTAYKRDEAYGLQAEGAWHAGREPHDTLRRRVSGRRPRQRYVFAGAAGRRLRQSVVGHPASPSSTTAPSMPGATASTSRTNGSCCRR